MLKEWWLQLSIVNLGDTSSVFWNLKIHCRYLLFQFSNRSLLLQWRRRGECFQMGFQISSCQILMVVVDGEGNHKMLSWISLSKHLFIILCFGCRLIHFKDLPVPSLFSTEQVHNRFINIIICIERYAFVKSCNFFIEAVRVTNRACHDFKERHTPPP